VDRSVYSNVTVIVVVVVSVCVLCNVSPMISHLFWSLEELLTDRETRLILSNYRRLVTRNIVCNCPRVYSTNLDAPVRNISDTGNLSRQFI